MLFELFFVKKYLTPRKKQLSVSLITLMSIGVIALVVWLLLLFLSITEGIERNWLKKLTALHAPIRIQPTEAYFSSYYYTIDLFSQASHFCAKTIGQKASALLSDPYDRENDPSLPSFMPVANRDVQGLFLDPVKRAYKALNSLGLAFQDYEMSGALMRLRLLRLQGLRESETQLTQVSYLASLTNISPSLPELILPPSLGDLNHLLYLSKRIPDIAKSLLATCEIELLRTPISWELPVDWLPENCPFTVHFSNSELILSEQGTSTLFRKGAFLFLNGTSISMQMPILLETECEWKVANQTMQTIVQNQQIQGPICLKNVEFLQAKAHTHFMQPPTISPLWPYVVENQLQLPQQMGSQSGVLLAKNFLESGVKIGDGGFLAYGALTASSLQEQRIPIYVAGFYDPGIMTVGNKCIFVPTPITQAINSSEGSYAIDRAQANGIMVWTEDIRDVKEIKEKIEKAFQENDISDYWKVITFREYDFAKDLLQQFESDKLLFTLIGAIILIVACCNIISLLILLIGDKKREIGILQAMGASKKSIAAIFGLSGAIMGTLGSFFGIGLALLTLHYIDQVVHFLSFLQGHEAFNALFFGKSLPKELSVSALTFVLIATPLLAFLAGLIPAIKACSLKPSEILKSP